MTSFAWAVAAAAAVAAAGSLWRMAGWRRLGLGQARTSARRGSEWQTSRGPWARRALTVLVLDVLGQRRLFARDPVRWAAHLALVVGFTGLFFLHALGDVVAVKLTGAYASTLGPWLWLRDLFGLMVLLGFAVGIPRRLLARGRLPAPRRRDPLFVGALLGIVLTGFVLNAIKITSAPAFERMLQEYASVNSDEAAALRAYWEAEYGVVFGPPTPPGGPAQRAAGEAVHQTACAACHDRPQIALASYPLSRLLRTAAPRLASWGTEALLLWLHLALCVFAIAYLPFSRLFHVVSAPVALLAGSGAASPRGLALDACLRCGLCDERCSVKALVPLYGHALMLPAVKLDALRAVARDRRDVAEGDSLLAEGAYACSDCARCTDGCPVGLSLDDLWAAGTDELRQRGEPPAADWVKATSAADWADRLTAAPATGIPTTPRYTSLTGDRRTFSPCVQCQTCTNVCPVVAHSDATSGVDVTPQKVMNLLRLGLADLALGSRMVWDCATCYQCQEHCPAGIRVTEVLYELRNRGYERLGELPRPGRAAVPGQGAS